MFLKYDGSGDYYYLLFPISHRFNYTYTYYLNNINVRHDFYQQTTLITNK